MEIAQFSPCRVAEPTSRYREMVIPDWVRPSKAPPFVLHKAKGRRAQLGVNYEKKVHQRLEELYELCYIAGTWFAYHWRGRIRYCQPDALLLLPDRKVLLIVEAKYSHTVDAYWQLEHLYLPVLRCFLGPGNPWHIATIEVVKWFDPAVAFPCKVTLCPDLAQVRVGAFNVHILNR